MKRLALLIAATGLVAATLPALAAGPGDAAMRRWKQADACVADATKKVPDHDAASQRKRDTLTNDCMKAHGLPPLTNVAPPETAQPAPAAPTAAPATTPPKPN